MSKMYLADNVGADGTVYPTVGENIRASSVTAENIVKAVDDNTDRAKICDSLDVTAENLKTAIINMLTGKNFYFGGIDIGKLSSSELADIKAYLGVV